MNPARAPPEVAISLLRFVTQHKCWAAQASRALMLWCQDSLWLSFPSKPNIESPRKRRKVQLATGWAWEGWFMSLWGWSHVLLGFGTAHTEVSHQPLSPLQTPPAPRCQRTPTCQVLLLGKTIQLIFVLCTTTVAFTRTILLPRISFPPPLHFPVSEIQLWRLWGSSRQHCSLHFSTDNSQITIILCTGLKNTTRPPPPSTKVSPQILLCHW